MQSVKATQVRVYLDPAENELAEKLAKTIGAETTWVVRRVVEEGLRALATKGCEEVTFPIRFNLETGKRIKAA